MKNIECREIDSLKLLRLCYTYKLFQRRSSMSQVEIVFNQLNERIEAFQTKEDLTYLDSFLNVLNLVLMDEETIGTLDAENAAFVKEIKAVQFDQEDKETIRKVIQFALLKSFKGAQQQQHTLTPDMVSFYMSYLIEKLFENKQDIRIFDPVVGSGNLLTGVLNQTRKHFVSYASEVDQTFIELALTSAELQKQTIEFFHQDSLKPLLLDPVDVVVSDLPVGYYPDDEVAANFDVAVKDEHTYAHHLLLEQSVKYVQPGGYVIALVPNHLFDSDQSKQLHMFIQKAAHVVALLQLPDDLFKSSKSAKSILVLQRKAENTEAPNEVLMAQLPRFKDYKATENIVLKMNAWFENY